MFVKYLVYIIYNTLIRVFLNSTIFLFKKKGSVITEYVLLLFVCVSCALLINKIVHIGSSPSESGWVIRAWINVLTLIAEDM